LGALSKIVCSGLAGAAASAAAAALFSRAENGHAARPLNAIAHIYDGGHPPAHDGNGRRNTLVGAGLHTAASIWWAVFYEGALSAQARPRRWRTAFAVAAVAYVVDYYVVGRRFQPGFERYLSPRAMFAVYAALAAGYAVSGQRRARVGERQDQRERAALPRRAREPQLAAEQPRQLAADRQS
jgi:hypothetical protein